MGAMTSQTPRHLVTVALEDYYHNFRRVIKRAHWSRFETRVEQSTLRTLDLLDEFGIRATFFSLGWIASTLPEVIREVARRGHEIASKGYHQRHLREMSEGEFRDDLARSREALEQASGQRVIGYRASGWLEEDDLWALEVLAEEQYVYDSSVKPFGYRLHHSPEMRVAHRRRYGTRTLWEFPISTVSLGGALIPVGAGNYFRQLPEPVMKWAVSRWHSDPGDAPFVMYFHTWELDPQQPHITAAPFLNRMRKYRNLGKVPDILRHYFARHSCSGIGDYLGIESAPRPVRASAPVVRRSTPILEMTVPPPAPAADGAPRSGVALVVPCYNEQNSLPYLANTLAGVERTLGSRYALEFVFVDDGSADDTWEALRKHFGSDPRATLLRHAQNRGVAAAIMTGIRYTRNPVICSIDCDCTYDPLELAHMIPLLTDDVDLVTASPYHPNGAVHNVPRWRLSLSKALSRIYRFVLPRPLHTYTSCFRVYRRSAVANLDISRGGFLGVAELLGKVILSGGRVVEHPATLEVRVLGQSKMKVARTIAGHLGLIGSFLAMRLTGRVPQSSVRHVSAVRAGDEVPLHPTEPPRRRFDDAVVDAPRPEHDDQRQRAGGERPPARQRPDLRV
jgi:polysaccharide deacetylase family protein (PEP-CTERM system associated)